MLDKFSLEEASPFDAADEKLAAASLMVRLARADNEYHRNERATIKTLLQTQYELSVQDAETLLSDAELLEQSAPDTVRFTRKLKESTSPDSRIKILEDLWVIALADEIRSDEENAFMRLIVSLFGLPDRENARTRQRAIARIGRQ